MKLRYLASVLLFTLPMGAAVANKLSCKDINGSVTLTPDPSCKVLTLQHDYFPDQSFLGSGYCFTATLTGTLGKENITGTALSGVTGISPSTMTAASATTLFDSSGHKLGMIITHDVLTNPGTSAAEEHLIMTNGTRTFSNGSGNLTIIGNTLSFQPTAFSGKVCAED